MPTVAVIGAGAAGIAAGRALREAGVDVVVFEARDRVGGRAHTDETFAAHPIELGAEFVHGQHVATWDWIRAGELDTLDDAHRGTTWAHYRGRLMDARAFSAAAPPDLLASARRAARAWMDAGRPDASLAEAIADWSVPGNGTLTDEGRALVANYVAQGTSADDEELGVYRGTEATYEGDGDHRHFRLVEGYGTLMRRAAEPLDVRLSTAVTRVRWDARGAEVTVGGAVVRFDRVVVTLPLGVLQRGTVEFDPPLPPEHRRAIDELNAGHIAKIVLKFDRVRWPSDLTFLWTPLATQLWWRPGQGRADEEPILTAFFGGADAARLEQATPEEAAAEGVRQLEAILGESLRGALRGSRYVAWGAEPHTWMGYSSLPPHGLGLRAALAAPAGALAFAGEATSVVRPATVHGAIESGRRAAAEILAARPAR